MVDKHEKESNDNTRQQNIFDQSLQYIEYQQQHDEQTINNSNFLSIDIFRKAAKPCALINGLYQIMSNGTSYSNIIEMAQSNHAFHDMIQEEGIHYTSTWSFCLKYFGGGGSTDDGTNSSKEKEKWFGDRTTRSIKKEKEALNSLKDLFIKFGGNVNLTHPDIRLVLLDGLGQRHNPKVSILNPNTRHCITNTPLCPITSIIMSNMGQINSYKNKVLDPYAGSCSTLLSSTLIKPTCTTVGIDIASEQSINRTDIMTDFSSRGLRVPHALLKGDFRNDTIRNQARKAIMGKDVSFDVILTDPPYGIRETTDWTLSSPNDPLSYNNNNNTNNEHPNNPLLDILQIISIDLKNKTPLLHRKHGRLVVFVPCTAQQTIEDMLPDEKVMEEAGLALESRVEQRLNDGLSRWLLVFQSKGM